MIKKILVLSSVLALSSPIAFASPAPYIGAGLGINVNTDAYSNYREMPLNVLAGYGGQINESFYLAGELNATLASAQLSDGAGYLKTTYGYGASVLPGFMLSDHTLVFARVGLVNTHFSSNAISKTKGGAQMGLGMQTSVMQNVDLRGEYDYTAYHGTNVYGMHTTPRTDAFNLSLLYKFD